MRFVGCIVVAIILVSCWSSTSVLADPQLKSTALIGSMGSQNLYNIHVGQDSSEKDGLISATRKREQIDNIKPNTEFRKQVIDAIDKTNEDYTTTVNYAKQCYRSATIEECPPPDNSLFGSTSKPYCACPKADKCQVLIHYCENRIEEFLAENGYKSSKNPCKKNESCDYSSLTITWL
jgi:hypothetical protein